MMTGGKKKYKDNIIPFGDTFGLMMHHNMQLPSEKINIRVPDARQVLHSFFEYVLSLSNDTLEWQPEYDEVADWLENNDGRGLFLFGDCGRGKSILTRFVLPAILLEYAGKIVAVYDTQQMNAELDKVLKKYILAIDDIGTEEVSVNFGNKRLAFFEIMDSVEKYSKLVIVSTNLSKGAIIEKYGERTYDRIIATTRRVEFKGKSLRK